MQTTLAIRRKDLQSLWYPGCQRCFRWGYSIMNYNYYNSEVLSLGIFHYGPREVAQRYKWEGLRGYM